MTVTRFHIDDQMILMEELDETTQEYMLRSIPLAAVASWSELLGITDPVETVAAIIYVNRHGEPEHDPVTGENAWTPAYLALAEMERGNGTVTKAAGKTMRMAATAAAPDLVAALPPVDQARNSTRSRLGLPLIPDEESPAMLRTMSAGLSAQDEPQTPLDKIMTELPTDLCTALTDRQGLIDMGRQAFLEQIQPIVVPQLGAKQ